MYPPPQILPVLQKVKLAYALWHQYVATIPKTFRYTLGENIDKYFLQTIENILIASFLQKQEKQPFVRKAIISLDTLNFLPPNPVSVYRECLRLRFQIEWYTQTLHKK